MAENTKIEWATHSFNPWLNCSKVSEACRFCYAEFLLDHRLHRVEWGGDRIRTKNWDGPLKWNAVAKAAGVVDSVFCLSLGDIWDKEVPANWRRELFDVIDQTPNLVWLLLSKRIGNAVHMMEEIGRYVLPNNCALGSTMIDQTEWDRDMPKLYDAGKALGAAFTFASVEPMLGHMDITIGPLPQWVICGGESGQSARPMALHWARSLRDQCDRIGVPFLFKQWGEWRPDGEKVGKAAAGRSLDGRTWDQRPAALAWAR